MLAGSVLVVVACADAGTSGATTAPFLAGVTAGDAGRVFRGTFSPDGSEFFFFRRVSEGGEDFRVFRVDIQNARLEAQLLPLGDGRASSMYPVVSPDGSLLVFSSYRGEGDNADLWAAPRLGSGWGDPYRLAASTTGNYDASPWFDAQGRLRFTSTTPDWSTTRHYMSARVGADFVAPTEDLFWEQFEFGPDLHFWSGILDQGGTLAILEVSRRESDGTLAGSDLWLSRRSSSGSWTRPAAIAGDINTPGTENFPTFSPDGSALVFVRDFSEFLRADVRGLRSVDEMVSGPAA